MSRDQSRLVERLRSSFADQPVSREVAMFGGRSFMVNEKLVVSALKTGDLLVRVAPERTDELLAIPGASPAQMGANRFMGPRWISVTAASIADDKQLTFWVDCALECNSCTTTGGSSRPAHQSDMQV